MKEVRLVDVYARLVKELTDDKVLSKMVVFDGMDLYLVSPISLFSQAENDKTLSHLTEKTRASLEEEAKKLSLFWNGSGLLFVHDIAKSIFLVSKVQEEVSVEELIFSFWYKLRHFCVRLLPPGESNDSLSYLAKQYKEEAKRKAKAALENL